MGHIMATPVIRFQMQPWICFLRQIWSEFLEKLDCALSGKVHSDMRYEGAVLLISAPLLLKLQLSDFPNYLLDRPETSLTG